MFRDDQIPRRSIVGSMSSEPNIHVAKQCFANLAGRNGSGCVNLLSVDYLRHPAFLTIHKMERNGEAHCSDLGALVPVSLVVYLGVCR